MSLRRITLTAGSTGRTGPLAGPLLLNPTPCSCQSSQSPPGRGLFLLHLQRSFLKQQQKVSI